MRIAYEQAICAVCKRQFQRAARGRRRQVCERKNCIKISKLGHEKPVSLDTINSHAQNFQYVQGQYHGGYVE